MKELPWLDYDPHPSHLCIISWISLLCVHSDPRECISLCCERAKKFCAALWLDLFSFSCFETTLAGLAGDKPDIAFSIQLLSRRRMCSLHSHTLMNGQDHKHIWCDAPWRPLRQPAASALLRPWHFVHAFPRPSCHHLKRGASCKIRISMRY